MSKLATALLLLVTLLGGCSKREDAPITLQLNWKPEPEFGGFYAADFAKHGLNVAVTPGGAGTPTIDLLGAGKVPYAIVSSEEIPKARETGIHAVAIFSVYQRSPVALMTQASRQLKSIDEIFQQPGTLAIEAGLPYAAFLKQKYGFDKVKVVPSPFGDLSLLRGTDPYAMQCFLTAEPLAAKKAGLDVTTFPIDATGYASYACVVATTDEYRAAHPDEVRRMVEAITEGWQKYQADPAATNEKMHGLNPTMEPATFAEAAAAQRPLLFDPDRPGESGLGEMNLQRWTAIVDELKQTRVIKTEIDPKTCFVNPTP